MLSDISQTEKDKYPMISLICGISKNKTKLKQTHKHREKTGCCQRGEGQGDEQRGEGN